MFGYLLELSLTVPIVNAMAFLFTVLGEWFVEGKVVSRGMFTPCPPNGYRRESYWYQRANGRTWGMEKRYWHWYGSVPGGNRLVCSKQDLKRGQCSCIKLCFNAIADQRLSMSQTIRRRKKKLQLLQKKREAAPGSPSRK